MSFVRVSVSRADRQNPSTGPSPDPPSIRIIIWMWELTADGAQPFSMREIHVLHHWLNYLFSFFTWLDFIHRWQWFLLFCSSSHGVDCQTSEVTNSHMVLPAYNSTKHCLFQSDPLLFSCVRSNQSLIRICPCRDYIKDQIALCKACI